MSDKEITEKQSGERIHSDWGWSHSGGLMPGLILILVGLIFLARNYLGFSLHNWWALFILIPAMNNLGAAWRHYQRSGEIGPHVRREAFWGVLLFMVSFAFLFDLDFGLLWPFFLILAGIGMLLGGFGG